MAVKYDLHCHSTASDGTLTPSQLLQRAKAQNVSMLALTDHDTTAGLLEAQQAATELGIQFINGIELSTSWEGKCFHIVGLDIDPQAAALSAGIKTLQQIRSQRAHKIALKLAKLGIDDAYAAVSSAAGAGMITRSHFAHFLLAEGKVKTAQEAFDKYLAQGKAAYIHTDWADLAEAINWIKQAGGIAVLAHPLRYPLNASWMRRLLSAFKDAGGVGIEVVTGRSNAEDIKISREYAQKFDLYASVGSDFHSPDNQWLELGRLAELPKAISPVWDLF